MQSLNGSPVNNLVWEQYQKQKARGTEGFGVFDGRHTVKAALEKRMKRWFKRGKNDTDLLLFHHRYPTSTINVKRAAHPFNTGDYFGATKYVLVHNGVIRNPDDVKKGHDELGITYQSVLQDGSYNDSESLLWDMALTLEGKQEDLKAYGGVAFVCIKLVDNKPSKLYFGRNYGRPLNLDRSKDSILLSSEGAGAEIKEGQLYTYNYELNRLTHKHFRIPAYNPDYYNSSRDEKNTNRSWNSGSSYIPPSQTTLGSNYHVPFADNQWDKFEDGEDDFWVDAEGYAHRMTDDDWDEYYDNKYGKAGMTSPTLLADILAIQPRKQDVDNRAFKAIMKAKGHYSTAYWQLCGEYGELEDEVPTNAVKKEMAVLMAAIEVLSDEPGFENEESYHPLWRRKDEPVGKKSLIIPGRDY